MPLCNIINSTIDDGTFPTVWKSAKVFALHKGGSPSDINNYRPISVLSVCSKIIERHVHNSFSSYLRDNSLLIDSQSGFRKHNSCFTCLSKMINDWLHQLNTDKFIGFITLDFRKASDILTHEIILKKLALYGCDNLSLSWFKSYLENRTQVVHINKVSSDMGQILYGVPQGSIIGPLLFIVYINDLVFEVKYSRLYMYADDSNLACYDTNINDLQDKLNYDLNQIHNWCLANRMAINTSKSKSMLVCTPQKRVRLFSDILNVRIGGVALDNVSDIKVIDKNLTWKPHIEHLYSQLYKLIGLLWRNRHMLPKCSKILFYNSFILTKIDYCLPIWGNAAQVHLDKIWRLQKRAIRIIHNVSLDAPTESLFKELHCLNIYQRYFYQICVTTYVMLNTIDSPLRNLVTLQPTARYNLRSDNDNFMLKIPFPHKEIFKSSLSYACASNWNKLPNIIRSSQSLIAFKCSCKKYAISIVI